ncbi:MAG: hypothetical protein HXX20_14830 [Chloroflexi bacterium]|nr:hypothetical protein [Chloroflexota bacterium]
MSQSEGTKKRGRVQGIYAKYLTEAEQAFLQQAEMAETGERAASLDEEIQVVRLVVLRALQSDKPGDVTRAALAVAKLKQMKQQMAGDQATGIVEALDQVLTELGLGEGTVNGS